MTRLFDVSQLLLSLDAVPRWLDPVLEGFLPSCYNCGIAVTEGVKVGQIKKKEEHSLAVSIAPYACSFSLFLRKKNVSCLIDVCLSSE